MKRAPKYTISVLCMNHRQLTENCLNSIAEHSGDDYQLIVTNNNSTDDTKQYLESARSQFGDKLTLIHNSENLGFIKPNNEALKLAKGEYFVCLNNDMVVCAKWLDELSAPFERDPKMGITGAGANCCCIDNEWKAFSGNPPDYIEGSCLMIPTVLAKRHGLFSEYLKFAYCEDTDLSFRLRELGYKIKSVKSLPIHHDHPSSTARHMDLRDVLKHNVDEIKKRWAFYISRRSFQRRVLVRRLGARGDVLLITPILKVLREKWPQAQIHVWTKHPEMLRDVADMAVNKVGYYDVLIDLDASYEAHPELHIIDAYAKVADVTVSKRWTISMSATPADHAWSTRKSRGLKVALIHGGVTTWPGKNWPVDRMAEIVSRLKRDRFFTIAVGAEDSPDCGCDDVVTGQCSPQALYALAKQASLFVGLDSMPQHVASAANCPSVVLFGPTNPWCIIRPSPYIIPVQASREQADCVGAHGRRTIPITQAPCDGACIKAISVDMVVKAIDRVRRLTP